MGLMLDLRLLAEEWELPHEDLDLAEAEAFTAEHTDMGHGGYEILHDSSREFIHVKCLYDEIEDPYGKCSHCPLTEEDVRHSIIYQR